jgi:negative regulator of flagellin synthesis FlgM
MTIDRPGSISPATVFSPAERVGSEVQARAPLRLGAASVAGAPAGVQQPVGSSGPVEVGRIVRELAASPPVDPARVAALKVRIEGGAYPLDPAAIADAMLANERSRG